MISVEQLQSSILALPIGEQEQLVAVTKRYLDQHYAMLKRQDEYQQMQLAKACLDERASDAAT